MNQFYNPHRSSKWNYGGEKWRLSRSKIDLFVECPKCFYLDNKLGVKRVPPFPLNLNSAVDALLKKEFDIYREEKSAHPLMEQYGIDAVPFVHADMDTWRENFEGIETTHEKTGLVVCGAVDDVWVTPSTELIIVDYKSTSKDEKITKLDEDWHAGYKRQMEIYQWLFRQNGFKVSNLGYFVYANADKSVKDFDSKLVFDMTLIGYNGKDIWVEQVLLDIKKCLDSSNIPEGSEKCDHCRYRDAVEKVSGNKINSIQPSLL